MLVVPAIDVPASQYARSHGQGTSADVTREHCMRGPTVGGVHHLVDEGSLLTFPHKPCCVLARYKKSLRQTPLALGRCRVCGRCRRRRLGKEPPSAR